VLHSIGCTASEINQSLMSVSPCVSKSVELFVEPRAAVNGQVKHTQLCLSSLWFVLPTEVINRTRTSLHPILQPISRTTPITSYFAADTKLCFIFETNRKRQTLGNCFFSKLFLLWASVNEIGNPTIYNIVRVDAQFP
jgi:hypothetical protein